jgi:hypothetical protein
MFAPRPEHDKIQTRWAIDILLKNMLEKVWWVDLPRWNFEVKWFGVQWIV